MALELYATAQENRVKGLPYDRAKTICEQITSTHLQHCSLKITRPTLIRYFEKGIVTKCKMGPPSTISETILRAVALHCSMCQVSGMGEAKPRELKGILSAAVRETKHEASFELESVYRKAISSQAETMQNSKRQQNEDIRSQWTTFEKISIWLKDSG